VIPDGTYTAVVDEVEDSLARLELEDANEELYDLVLDIVELPAAGRETGSVLTIEFVDSEVTDAEFDPEATERRSETAQDRFDQLSRRPNKNR
jgi:hypothetical protein